MVTVNTVNLCREGSLLLLHHFVFNLINEVSVVCLYLSHVRECVAKVNDYVIFFMECTQVPILLDGGRNDDAELQNYRGKE